MGKHHSTARGIGCLAIITVLLACSPGAWPAGQANNGPDAMDHAGTGQAAGFTPPGNFQGTGTPLHGVATARFDQQAASVVVTGDATTNLSLFLDEAHGWEGTRVAVNVSNLMDTRDWVRGGSANDSGIAEGLVPATRVNYTYWYPYNNSYLSSQTFDTTRQTYINNGSRAYRFHFLYLNLLHGSDQVIIRYLNGTNVAVYTGTGSNFFTPWIHGHAVQIGYSSTIQAKNARPYFIDYIEHVPVNETHATLLETPHPYPNDMTGTTGHVLQAASNHVYMRARFAQLDIEGNNYDRLRLYDNNSVNFQSYGLTGSGRVNVKNLWTPWWPTNRISFNLTTDDTISYYGYRIDAYELSSVAPASFAANAQRLDYQIHWNQYLNNHQLGQDNLTLAAPGASMMRLNFSHVNFEDRYDYLVLYDNQSRFLMDFTGYHPNVLTPWFPTNSITMTYVSDTTGVGEIPIHYGAKLNYYEWTTTMANFTGRADGWTWTYDYDSVDGRARGYPTIRGSELGLGLEIQGVPRSEGTYSYERFSYEASDKSSFTQVIPIDRGAITGGYIKLDYWGEKLLSTNDFELFAAINGTVIFSRGFTTINQRPREWQSTGRVWMPLWTNVTDLFGAIQDASSIELEVGIRYAYGGSITYTGFKNADRQVLVIDDIELVLVSLANASQPDIDLRVDGIPLVDGGGWGIAGVEADGTWTVDPVTLGYTSASPHLTFDVAMTLDVEHAMNSTWTQGFGPEAAGTLFTVEPGHDVSWSFYENVYIPQGYTAYVLNVSIPAGWNVSSLRDPTGTARGFSGGGPGDGWFSFTATAPGWYLASAASPNAMTSIMLSPDGIAWAPALELVNGGSFHASAGLGAITTGTGGTGYARVSWPNGTVWYDDEFPVGNGEMNVTIGPLRLSPSNSTGGTYTGAIAWENGTAAGTIQFSLHSRHDTSLHLMYPVDARNDNRTSQLVESILPVRFLFNDTFTNRLVSGAIVSGVLNSTSAINVSFTETTTGVYDTNLDTTGLAEGIYALDVVASKPGYGNASVTLVIELNVDTYVQGFNSFVTVEHGFNATVSFHYHDAVRDIGVPGASIITSLGGTEHHIVDHGNGDYSVIVNSTALDLGTTPFSVVVSKAQHKTIDLHGTINVVPRASILDLLNVTLSGFIGEPVQPVMLHFHHPTVAQVNYTNASFDVFLDAGLATPLDPSHVTLLSSDQGIHALGFQTGPATPFNTTGIKTIHVVAKNGSGSVFHVSNAVTTISFSLVRRPVASTVALNGTGITGQPSIVAGMQFDLLFNVSITDTRAGGPATGFDLSYTITSGAAGAFTPQGSAHVALVPSGDLVEGTWVLAITGTSPVHEPVSIQYLLTVTTIATYVSGFQGYRLAEHGTNVSIAFRFREVLSAAGIPGAAVNVSLDGVGQLDPAAFWFVDALDGNYTITIDTTGLPLGTTGVAILVHKPFFQQHLLEGIVEVEARKARLGVLNATFTVHLEDVAGPVVVSYYHPTSAGVTYPGAIIMLFLDAGGTIPLDPAGYAVVDDGNGQYRITLQTGVATPFNVTGIHEVFARASNGSASSFHVEPATTSFTFSLVRRPITTTVHVNGDDASGTSVITANLDQGIVVNITVTDTASGEPVLLSLQYAITNGPSGSFDLVNGIYTRDVSQGSFADGTHVLSITSSSPVHETISRVFLLSLVPREMIVSMKANGTVVNPSDLIEAVAGQSLVLEANVIDASTTTPVTSAVVNVTLGAGFHVVLAWNGTSHVATVATASLLPGFHAATATARAANYTTTYMAFTVQVHKIALNVTATAAGTTLTVITPVAVVLGANTTISFHAWEAGTGQAVPFSGIVATVPTVMGAASMQASGNVMNVTFNSSSMGVGRRVVSITFSGAMYDAFVVTLAVEVLPLPLLLNGSTGQSQLRGAPGRTVVVSMTLRDERDRPVIGAGVTYAWAGGFGFLADRGNGTYDATLTLPIDVGVYEITISAYLDDEHQIAQQKILVAVQIDALSQEEAIANIITIALILGGFFTLVFALYLRPKLVKRRMTRYEEVKTCTVHKGSIKEGLTYVCPTCASIYCTKCAQALFNNNDPCWVCATPIAPFAVSYQDDWRKNLQYLFVFMNGASREPIFEQSMSDDVMMPEMLGILRKSISTLIAGVEKKRARLDVQEYFNSKIIFARGEFVTAVMVSKIESSFITEKVKEFVEEFELLFYDKDAKNWRAGMQDKLYTKTRFLIEKGFMESIVTEKPGQVQKGKGPGKDKAKDAADSQHKGPRPTPPAGPAERERASGAGEPLARPAVGEHAPAGKAFIPVSSPVRDGPTPQAATITPATAPAPVPAFAKPEIVSLKPPAPVPQETVPDEKEPGSETPGDGEDGSDRAD